MQKDMKNILKYACMAVAVIALLASCNKNEPAVFDDAEAFVAFQKSTAIAAEDDSVAVRIPVTLASVAGLSESIKFEIASPEEKAAKEGVNFDLLTTSGVLSFDKDHRTQYIEIMPKTDGAYTGDLKFIINLVASSSIKLGAASSCTVTITDVDHPLAAILGAYTATGVNQWNGPTEWTMTLYKDAEDDHKVWFDNLFDVAGWAGDDMLYYGNVNDDMTIINIPFGQESEYKYSNGKPVTLLGFDGSAGYDTGSVDVKIIQENGKVTLDFGEWGIWVWIEGAGNLNITKPGIIAVKN